MGSQGAAGPSWSTPRRVSSETPDGHPENALTRDQMLDDVTLYWLTWCTAHRLDALPYDAPGVVESWIAVLRG